MRLDNKAAEEILPLFWSFQTYRIVSKNRNLSFFSVDSKNQKTCGPLY